MIHGRDPSPAIVGGNAEPVMLLLRFQAADNHYAVDVHHVAEVLPRVHCRRIPHAPASLVGVFDYRGVAVPVIDLGILLGGSACRDRLSTRIIVIDLRPAASGHEPAAMLDAPEDQPDRPHPLHKPGRWMAGLVAEQVSDVAEVQPEQVISPTMNLPEAPYLGAIVDIGGEMTQFIVVDQLFDRSFRESFFEGAPPPAAAQAAAMGS